MLALGSNLVAHPVVYGIFCGWIFPFFFSQSFIWHFFLFLNAVVRESHSCAVHRPGHFKKNCFGMDSLKFRTCRKLISFGITRSIWRRLYAPWSTYRKLIVRQSFGNEMYDWTWFVGLVPRATVVVQRTDQQGVVVQGEGAGKTSVLFNKLLSILAILHPRIQT